MQQSTRQNPQPLFLLFIPQSRNIPIQKLSPFLNLLFLNEHFISHNSSETEIASAYPMDVHAVSLCTYLNGLVRFRKQNFADRIRRAIVQAKCNGAFRKQWIFIALALLLFVGKYVNQAAVTWYWIPRNRIVFLLVSLKSKQWDVPLVRWFDKY